jgi:hypothetical protein
MDSEGVEVQRELKFELLREKVRDKTRRKQRPKCIGLYTQNKVVSIHDHYYPAPEKISYLKG